jgi:hypothetical protein
VSCIVSVSWLTGADTAVVADFGAAGFFFGGAF